MNTPLTGNNRLRLFATSLGLALGLLQAGQSHAQACDPCINGAASTALSTMISTGYQQQAASAQTVEPAIKAVEAEVEDWNKNLIGKTKPKAQGHIPEWTSKMVGATLKAGRDIEISVALAQEITQRNHNNFTQTLFTAIRQAFTAKQNELIKYTYDAFSLTSSGNLGSVRAPLLAAARAQAKTLRSEIAGAMHAWSSDYPEARNISQTVFLKQHYSEPEEVWDILPLLQKNVLTQEESKNMQRLLTIIMNPLPSSPLSQTMASMLPNPGQVELERRATAAEQELIHAIATAALVDKQPLVANTNTWNSNYLKAATADSNSSINEVIRSESFGRLSSPGWFQEMKSRNQAGVMRETIYLNAINNAQQQREDIARQQGVWLLSILARDKLQGNR